ncbi:hypothetical protein [Lancefieldella rimae]|jgi:hypothetical protein|uniref:hypothetical protein n=1 Tax=Lancefieldella rimae TaxID=1383 RepID=UPI0028E6D0E3|nr:hypothetical protein [Lancefieldella rimae]
MSNNAAERIRQLTAAAIDDFQGYISDQKGFENVALSLAYDPLSSLPGRTSWKKSSADVLPIIEPTQKAKLTKLADTIAEVHSIENLPPLLDWIICIRYGLFSIDDLPFPKQENTIDPKQRMRILSTTQKMLVRIVESFEGSTSKTSGEDVRRVSQRKENRQSHEAEQKDFRNIRARLPKVQEERQEQKTEDKEHQIKKEEHKKLIEAYTPPTSTDLIKDVLSAASKKQAKNPFDFLSGK